MYHRAWPKKKKKTKHLKNYHYYTFLLIVMLFLLRYSWCIILFSGVIVQLLSHVWLFVIPWTAARQVSLSFTVSQSLLKLMSVKSVMPFNHLILCWPLLLLPSVFPSIKAFSNELALFQASNIVTQNFYRLYSIYNYYKIMVIFPVLYNKIAVFAYTSLPMELPRER